MGTRENNNLGLTTLTHLVLTSEIQIHRKRASTLWHFQVCLSLFSKAFPVILFPSFWLVWNDCISLHKIYPSSKNTVCFPVSRAVLHITATKIYFHTNYFIPDFKGDRAAMCNFWKPALPMLWFELIRVWFSDAGSGVCLRDRAREMQLPCSLSQQQVWKGGRSLEANWWRHDWHSWCFHRTGEGGRWCEGLWRSHR